MPVGEYQAVLRNVMDDLLQHLAAVPARLLELPGEEWSSSIVPLLSG